MKMLNLPKEKTFIGPALIWKRIAAFFIDMAIINLVVLFPFRSLFKNIIPKDYSFSEAYKFLSTSTDYTRFISSVSLVISILVILYFLMLERKTAQTIGKMLMKIYVVDARENDMKVSLRFLTSNSSSRSTSDADNLKTWQLLIRNLVFIPIFPFVLLWAVDPLFMFFTKTNQRLTEILSRTRVVEKYSLEQQI
ncbi:MAG: RDD family protein [Nanoarchaeota archaeon]|nr:RDD family protein [Nanoarchaeota archaeon]